MISVIIAFPKIENARNLKGLLVKNGIPVAGVCTTGAQVLSYTDELNYGIVLCGYKLADMICLELQEDLPPGFEILLVASGQNLSEVTPGKGILCLSMPLKAHELIDTVNMMLQNMEYRKKKQRKVPRERSAQEIALIAQAKEVLINRNHMTEEEAHKYIQKCSMDSGTNMTETAQMILAMTDG